MRLIKINLYTFYMYSSEADTNTVVAPRNGPSCAVRAQLHKSQRLQRPGDQLAISTRTRYSSTSAPTQTTRRRDYIHPYERHACPTTYPYGNFQRPANQHTNRVHRRHSETEAEGSCCWCAVCV